MLCARRWAGSITHAAPYHLTFVVVLRRWQCCFETEHPSAEVMRAALRACCESGIRGLAAWLSLRGAPGGPSSGSSNPGSPSHKRAPVIGAVAPAPAVDITATVPPALVCLDVPDTDGTIPGLPALSTCVMNRIC